MDDPEGPLFLTAAAEDFAERDVLQCFFSAFMLATLIALQKRGGGARGIATDIVSTLDRPNPGEAVCSWGQVEHGCAPVQFALSTRAGTDCVGDAIRVVTERQPDMTDSSIDGIGAYDHVHRSSMMSKLMDVTGLRVEGAFPTVSVRTG